MNKIKKRLDVWQHQRAIIQAYVKEKLSARQLAYQYHCSWNLILDILRESDFKPRSVSAANLLVGKGGRVRDQKGYIHVKSPEHPNRRAQHYILEHRLIMEQKLGRFLLPSEKVHHINGIRDDNRPENLLLLSPAEHTLQHNMCNQCGLRKEIRLLRWQLMTLTKQLQGHLI